MVKSGGDAMTNSLLLLMRQSSKQGRLPTIWAAADVRLTPKKTRPTNFGDFRPISLLPTVAKLMEAVVQARMARLAEEHAWIRPNQAGFRAGGSALDSLTELQQRAHSAWARGNYLVAVAADIS